MLFSRSPRITLSVEGMSCGHCEQAVENGLKEIAGVTKVKADHRRGLVEVQYRDQLPDQAALLGKISELGYTVKA